MENEYPVYRYASGAVHNDFSALQARHARKTGDRALHLEVFRTPKEVELLNLLDSALASLLRSCRSVHRSAFDFGTLLDRFQSLLRQEAGEGPRHLSKLDHYAGTGTNNWCKRSTFHKCVITRNSAPRRELIFSQGVFQERPLLAFDLATPRPISIACCLRNAQSGAPYAVGRCHRRIRTHAVDVRVGRLRLATFSPFRSCGPRSAPIRRRNGSFRPWMSSRCRGRYRRLLRS